MNPPVKDLAIKYGLPAEVQYCVRCTGSNQRPCSVVEFSSDPKKQKPTLHLDHEGVCAACRFFDKKKIIDWNQREAELKALLDRHRRSDGSYDCVVPSSGGKDSGFVAHILKSKYGMHPLTVTWAPHLYTDIGWKNLQSFIHSGFDNILFTPNGKVHRLLTQIAFLNLAHPFQPFILGQKNIGPRFSILYNIPLVIYGEHLAEYGKGPDVALMDPGFYAVDRIELDKIKLGGVAAEELIRNHKIDLVELNPYLPVVKKNVKRVGTEVHCFSYYKNWDPQENYYYAVENTGYEGNSERTVGSYSKYSSIDDVLDHLHYYTTFIKFGIGRAGYDAEQEVRTGKITRQEAVGLIRRYDGEFPQKYFKTILDYLQISEKQFHETIDSARSPHLWYHQDGRWHLRHQVS